ncbi:hypothetical protein ABZT26_02570 [Streptomyces sp. NPDC005395]|uniref:hypothetical protein n=1 Tax=unclassified Streptomyces TaxID=2593676 RepID=UPI001F239114|nr:hypothetical protein [Streptomyces sp. BSE6.1]
MATIYYRTATGSLVMADVSDGVEPHLPEGAEVLTADEYQAEVDAAEAVREAKREQTRQENAQAARSAYDALIAAGIPDETARRLSGYWETDDEPDPEHDPEVA